jgi:hypothetical protein
MWFATGIAPVLALAVRAWPRTDPALRAQAVALDRAMPKPEGGDAAAMDRFRARMARLVPAREDAAALARSEDLSERDPAGEDPSDRGGPRRAHDFRSTRTP